VCLCGPVLVTWGLSTFIRQQISDSDAITVLSAVAVVAGFLGSVSVSAIGNVQRIVSEYPFSSYLREEKLFDLFLFWPQFTLLCQVALLLLSVSMAVALRLFDLSLLSKYVIAVDVGLLVYVCTKTWNLIDLMRKLTWHYEEYKRVFEEAKTKAANAR